MSNETALKLLPIVSDEQKIEVSLEDDKAVIRLSTFEGELGWCGQKTLEIDVEMLDDLHRAISAARYKSNKASEPDAANKVLNFPIFT